MSKFKLKPEQEAALDSTKHIFVEAGAGTGKTRILVERYIDILTKNKTLELDAIVAFTFTQKAALEMITRIQETVSQENITIKSELKNKILENLHTAPISTIHQFCLRCLKQFPLEAEIDPDIQLLDPLHATYLFNQTVKETINKEIKNETALLQDLLQNATINQLKSDIKVLANNHSFLSNKTLKEIPEKTLEETVNTLDYKPTKIAHDYIQNLYNLYSNCKKNYQNKKKKTGKCDFDDLILQTIQLMKNNPNIQKTLQTQHPYLMVDEFQDTDPLQWKLITTLIGGTKPDTFKTNLFLVGDLKQSIYSFRGATAELFTSVQKDFLNTPNITKTITLKDNFRSHKEIMNTINYLFPSIFENDSKNNKVIPTVNYQKLTGNKENDNGGIIHTCFIEDKNASIEYEINAIIQWIITHTTNYPNTKLEDIAILFRRKAHMEKFKKKFENYHIPTQLLSQQNLYQNQAIIDAFAILKVLIDPHNKLNWRTILRSPMFNWNETDIYELFQNATNESIFNTLKNPPSHINTPTQKNWLKTSKIVSELLQISKENPLSQCLEWILVKTGAWALYAKNKHGESTCNMLEQFIQKCESLEKELLLSNLDMIDIIESSIETGEKEKETISKGSPGHISLLSIHGSKGLEYPIVIIPECSHRFYVDKTTRLAFSTDLGPGLNIKRGKHENKHRKKVLNHLTSLTIEEEKRLFYVACTRAIDHLVLSASYKPTKLNSNSYLGFLNKIKPVENGIFLPNKKITNIIPFNLIEESLEIAKKEIPSKTKKETLLEPNIISPLKDEKKESNETSISTTPLYLTPQSLGTLSHQALQVFIESPQKSLNTITNNIIHQNNIPLKHFKIIHTHILSHLETLSANPLIKTIRTCTHLETEKPFTFKEKNELIRGRADLIFQINTTLHIVDFKTSSINQSEYKKTIPTYKKQLEKYAKALKNSYKNIQSIQITLLQTYLNRTDTWDIPKVI